MLTENLMNHLNYFTNMQNCMITSKNIFFPKQLVPAKAC